MTSSYTTHMNVFQMKFLDLFDEIPYKFCKEVTDISEEESYHYDIRVNIDDLPIPDHERYNRRKTLFEFDLSFKEESGVDVKKTFRVIKYYDTCSKMSEFIDDELKHEDSDYSDGDY